MQPLAVSPGRCRSGVAPDIPARAGSGSQRDAGSVAMPTDGAETDVYGEDAFDAGRGESEPARREPARHTPASGSKVGAADDGKPVTAEDIDQEIQQKEETDPLKEYLPALDLLKKGKATGGNTEEQLQGDGGQAAGHVAQFRCQRDHHQCELWPGGDPV